MLFVIKKKAALKVLFFIYSNFTDVEKLPAELPTNNDEGFLGIIELFLLLSASLAIPQG